jgi:haloalkane dehalogenase
LQHVADVFRTPDERFSGLPGYEWEPRYADVDGLRLHYVDEGASDGRPVVCFHGEPTWAFLYRKLARPLLDAGERVVAVDMPGFGRSDKPTERGWYSFERHYEHVARVLAGLELDDATVVVQDWGGAVGLRWAVENADRVGRLAIMNTGLFTGRVSKGFLRWRDFAERNPDLPVGFIVDSGCTSELTPEVKAAYEAPFPTPESKAGAAAFPLLVPTSEDAPGAAEMLAVSDELSRWDKPALVMFSDSDPVFPYPRAGQVFCDLIPGAGEQVRVEAAAHFLQEDSGEEIGERVLELLRGGVPRTAAEETRQ